MQKIMTMPIIRCRHCGKIIPPESDFCPHCGHSTENQVVDTYGSSVGEASASCLKGIFLVIAFLIIWIVLVELFPAINSFILLVIVIIFVIALYFILFKRK